MHYDGSDPYSKQGISHKARTSVLGETQQGGVNYIAPAGLLCFN